MSAGPHFVDHRTDSTPLAILRSIVAEHGMDMVGIFYDTLLRDEEAKEFLSHSAVHERLSGSLRDWLFSLLGDEDIAQSEVLKERQRVIGQVHARIKIPIHLVLFGAMLIKQNIASILLKRNGEMSLALQVAQLANDRIDMAMLLMSQAYVRDVAGGARVEEAYRLFSLDQDITVEKEAQRAGLMEWSQKTLFTLLRGDERGGLDRIAASEFGFWIRHRAEFMFDQSPIFRDLVSEVDKVDESLLPRLEDSALSNQKLTILAELQTAVDRISFLIGELFQSLAVMEGGRDPLTRTLNRRFLPAILGREITFANSRQTPLTLLMVDVDRFKAINDRHGHQTGDLVLRQVAQAILENVRPSDFVFRYGGEEFLVLFAETPAEEARDIAERIRSDLSTRHFDIGSSVPLAITASIGVAQHSGHPDQRYLIKAADDALRNAKANGRNRVEMAPL